MRRAGSILSHHSPKEQVRIAKPKHLALVNKGELNVEPLLILLRMFVGSWTPRRNIDKNL